MNNKTVIGIILAVLFGSGGLVKGYYTLQAKAENTEVAIVEIKEDIDKVEEDIDVEENVNIAQTCLIEQLTKTVSLLNNKIEKELTQ